MVIDSNLFIEYFRAKDKSATALAQLPKGVPLFISAVSVFELFVGANTPERVAQTEVLLKFVWVLPMDEAVARLSGRLYDDLQRAGQKREFRDVMIAATAIHARLPLKTLNFRHFDQIPNLVLA